MSLLPVPTLEHLVSGLFTTLSFAKGVDLSPEYGRVLNSKKVSDHHAIIPTAEAVKIDPASLPESERNILLLIGARETRAATVADMTAAIPYMEKDIVELTRQTTEKLNELTEEEFAGLAFEPADR